MTGVRVRVLGLDEIRQLVDPAQAITAVREALIAHTHAQVTNPPPWHLELPDVAGEVHVKGAHVHDSP